MSFEPTYIRSKMGGSGSAVLPRCCRKRLMTSFFGHADFQVRPVVRFVIFGIGNLDWIAEIVRQRVHVYSRYSRNLIFLGSTRFLFLLFPFCWTIRTTGALVCSFLKQRDAFVGQELLVAFYEPRRADAHCLADVGALGRMPSLIAFISLLLEETNPDVGTSNFSAILAHLIPAR